jgi:SAM-dependent methyltransferase
MQTSGLAVAPGNEAQAEAWNGAEGELWARYPEFFDGATRRHHTALMAAASVGSRDQVLDIGCGTGGSTIEAAQVAHLGAVLGIDLSERMLQTAREIAARRGVTNATFVQGDAQVYPFEPGSFDVAVSRTGSSFFADQVAAFGNIARALRPGGRLALVSWRAPDRNEWFTSFAAALTLGRPLAPPPPEAPSPFAHADPARTTRSLTSAGFTDLRTDPLELPMRFGATAEEAFEVLSQLLAWMADDLTDDERQTAFESLRRSLEAHQTTDGVVYRSEAWVITATRA